ncbi:MAG: outer membrane beta-barrel protein [Syntrophorhabdales bacterium]|jgi:hypothetical protein
MGRLKRILALGLLICALSISLLRPAGAAIEYGHFTLLPELDLQEMFRSNLFLTQSDKKSDYVTTVTPGMGLKYLFGQSSFDLGYKVGFVDFAKYSANNYQDHRANGLLHLVAPGGLEFTLGDNFTKSTIERIQLMTHQMPFHDNFLNAAAAYSFADRWKIEAKYNREDLAFDEYRDRYAEYTNNLVGASLYYRFLPRMSGLVEYDYAAKDFVSDRLADHKDRLAYLGVAFDPAGKLKGNFKVGYGWKEFDTTVAGRDNSPRNWIMAGQLVDDLDARTSLTLDALRALADDTMLLNASYVNTLMTLTLQHFFTGKIGATAAISYQERAYIDNLTEPVTGALKKRSDEIWSGGAAAFYNIQKWLQARLEYQYRDAHSTFDQYSYTDHRIMFKIILTP